MLAWHSILLSRRCTAAKRSLTRKRRRHCIVTDGKAACRGVISWLSAGQMLRLFIALAMLAYR